MLTEKRHEYILQELKRKGSITVNEIKEELGISESTIRRDLNSLDEEGRLVKVFGGAVSADFEVSGIRQRLPPVLPLKVQQLS